MLQNLPISDGRDSGNNPEVRQSTKYKSSSIQQKYDDHLKIK